MKNRVTVGRTGTVRTVHASSTSSTIAMTVIFMTPSTIDGSFALSGQRCDSDSAAHSRFGRRRPQALVGRSIEA
jgi:hypothetical protein